MFASWVLQLGNLLACSHVWRLTTDMASHSALHSLEACKYTEINSPILQGPWPTSTDDAGFIVTSRDGIDEEVFKRKAHGGVIQWGKMLWLHTGFLQLWNVHRSKQISNSINDFNQASQQCILYFLYVLQCMYVRTYVRVWYTSYTRMIQMKHASKESAQFCNWKDTSCVSSFTAQVYNVIDAQNPFFCCE